MSGERPERLLKPREFCEIVRISYAIRHLRGGYMKARYML